MKKRMMISICFGLVLAACGSGVEGTYSDPASSYVMELKSGGEGSIRFMGQTVPCTYTADGDKITMNCQGQTQGMVFTKHDDGTLTPPAESVLPTLKKTK